MSQYIQPSPVAYSDVDLSWMIGRAIAEVSFHEPAGWCFTIGSGASIGVDCLWRIVEHGRVVLSGEDHGQKFGLPEPVDAAAKATALLTGQHITAVQLREATTDILIEFSGDLRLEIIANSSGYESWQLVDPSRTEYFAQGGGQICKWRP
jgi:hypothetical protein